MAITFNRFLIRKFLRSCSSYSGFKIYDTADSNLSFKKKFTKLELKEKLTPLQYDVTQAGYTERPFYNQYYAHDVDGIYKCVVCEEDLFSSKAKYDSNSGWPSFNDAVQRDKLTYIRDYDIGIERIEVKCGNCGSHLGHLFDDGPKPTKLRYCMNSSSLNFVKEK